MFSWSSVDSALYSQAANEIYELQQHALLDAGEEGKCNSMSNQETLVVLQK